MSFTPAEIDEIVGVDRAVVGGAYTGAQRLSDQLANWQPSRMPADYDIMEAKELGNARANDIIRNDAYVAGGQQLHQDSIVGEAFLLNSRPAYKVLGLDETWAAEFQEEVEEKFTLTAESPRCWLDSQGTKTLTEMVRLAVGLDVAAGEVLAVADWGLQSGAPCRTSIQMIELERLDTPPTRQENRFLRGGVERDASGRPRGYHIRVAHPYDFDSYSNFLRASEFRFYPARKPWGRLQVLHIYNQFQPGQSRGASPMLSALKELRIAKKFRDVTLQNAVVNATFAATIESELPTQAVFETLGAGGNTPSGAMIDYAGNYLHAIAQYSGSANNLHIDGVKIPHLFPGTKLNLQPAAANGAGIGTDFEKSLLRYLAANLGVSYEELSRDYTETNYSSARAAMLNTWKHMRARKRLVADRFATAIFLLWLEEMLNRQGSLSSMPRNAPSFYDGVNAEAYSACEWIGASRGQIDELKETQAAVLRLNHNLSTYEEEHARLGRDYRKVIAQRKRENALLDDAGLQQPGLIVEAEDEVDE